MRFLVGKREVDYNNATITENTRSAYPIEYIPNAVIPSLGGIPQHIFFLTCDAQGILPPIAKLNKAQAMYHFKAGYTAKVAGTEVGVTAPRAVYSACFGANFLPLHPIKYAAMLGRKMEEHAVSVWLINTGWIGGGYGVGKRMQLVHTRAIITAVLSGALDKATYIKHPIFGVAIPTKCPGIPAELLNHSNSWEDAASYTTRAHALAQSFVNNFTQYEALADQEIKSG